MRVLVVDESAEREEMLRAALRVAGYEVAGALRSPVALLETIEELDPDLVVIDIASPGRDVLEQLAALTRLAPRPVVMLAGERSPEAMKAMIHVAVVQFKELQDLRSQLAIANRRLDERKLVERAKGLLMKTQGLDEESAYRTLRRMAMDQSRRIGEVSRSVIEMAHLLG
jgi:response regulator NasT